MPPRSIPTSAPDGPITTTTLPIPSEVDGFGIGIGIGKEDGLGSDGAVSVKEEEQTISQDVDLASAETSYPTSGLGDSISMSRFQLYLFLRLFPRPLSSKIGTFQIILSTYVRSPPLTHIPLLPSPPPPLLPTTSNSIHKQPLTSPHKPSTPPPQTQTQTPPQPPPAA